MDDLSVKSAIVVQNVVPFDILSFQLVDVLPHLQSHAFSCRYLEGIDIINHSLCGLELSLVGRW